MEIFFFEKSSDRSYVNDIISAFNINLSGLSYFNATF